MKKNRLYLPLLCVFPIVVLAVPTATYYIQRLLVARFRIELWSYIVVTTILYVIMALLAAYLGVKCQKATLPRAAGGLLLALGILFVVLFVIAIIPHTYMPALRFAYLGLWNLLLAKPYYAYCLAGAGFYFVLLVHYVRQKPEDQPPCPPQTGYAAQPQNMADAPPHPHYPPQPFTAPQEGWPPTRQG